MQGAITCESGEAVFMPNRVFTSSALLGLAHANGMAKLEQGQHNYEEGISGRIAIEGSWINSFVAAHQ